MRARLRVALALLLAFSPILTAQGLPPLSPVPPMTTPAGALLLPNLTFTTITMTGQLLLANGTAAAPSLSFASATNTGLYRYDANGTAWSSGAVAYGYLGAGLRLSRDVIIAWTIAANDPNTTVDTTLARGSAGNVSVNARTSFGSTQNKQFSILDNAGALGVEFNVGTPTLGTCTGGSMVSGAKNTLFEVTGNSSGSCVVNFGTPIWQNAPLCFVNDETTLTAVRISARSTNAITVTGAVSGDAFQVYCLGRVGT